EACEGSAPLAPHLSSLTQPSHLLAAAGAEFRPLAMAIDAKATIEIRTNATFLLCIISSLKFTDGRSYAGYLLTTGLAGYLSNLLASNAQQSKRWPNRRQAQNRIDSPLNTPLHPRKTYPPQHRCSLRG